MKQKLMLMFALCATMLAVFSANAEETCWKANKGRALSLPTSCGPGNVFDAGLCYPGPKIDGEYAYDCVATYCSPRCPEGWENTGTGCTKPRRQRVFTWAAGDPAGNDGAFKRCESLWGSSNCKKATGISAEVNTQNNQACPVGWKSTGVECMKDPCPQGMTDSGLFCQKISMAYDRGAGVLPSCPFGLKNYGGLCYSPCPDGFREKGAVCWSDCPAVMKGGSPNSPECKNDGNMCDCGAMCGTSPLECAKSISNQVFAVINVALQVASTAIGIGGITGPIKAASSVANITMPIVQTTISTGLQAATPNNIAGSMATFNQGAVSTGVATFTADFSSAVASPLSRAGGVGTGLGIAAATNLANLGITAATGQPVDTKALMSLDPTGVGAAVAAFMLPSCDNAVPPDYVAVRVIADGETKSVPNVEHLDVNGSPASTSLVPGLYHKSGKQTFVGIRSVLTYNYRREWDRKGEHLVFLSWGRAPATATVSIYEEGEGNVDRGTPRWDKPEGFAISESVQGVAFNYFDALGQDNKMYRYEVVRKDNKIVNFTKTPIRRLFNMDSAWAAPEGVADVGVVNFIGADGKFRSLKREGNALFAKLRNENSDSFKAIADIMKKAGADIQKTANESLQADKAVAASLIETTKYDTELGWELVSGIDFVGADQEKWKATFGDGGLFTITRIRDNVRYTSKVLDLLDWSVAPLAVVVGTHKRVFGVFNPANPVGLEALDSYRKSDSRLAGFDPVFYGSLYDDIATKVTTDYGKRWHWLRFGLMEGRSPNASFSPVDYRNRYAVELKKLDYEALYNHWQSVGAREKRNGAAPLPPTGSLIRDRSTGAIYLVTTFGNKRPIASPQVMTECGFDWNAVQNMPKVLADRVPTGMPLTTGETCKAIRDPLMAVFNAEFFIARWPDLADTLKGNADTAKRFWLVDGFKARQGAAHFDFKTYVSRYDDVKKLTAYSTGGNDPGAAIEHWANEGRDAGRSAAVTGTIVRDPTNGAMFLVDRVGKKRGISSMQMFADCGLDLKNARNLGKYELDSVPTGPNFSSAAECQSQNPEYVPPKTPETPLPAGVRKGMVLEAGLHALIDANGKRRHLDLANPVQSCGINPQSVVKPGASVILSIPRGDDIRTLLDCQNVLREALAAPAAAAPAAAAPAPAAQAVRAGTLVKGASAAVYIIDASGQKRGIASGEVFNGCGLDWGKVQTLPEAQINQIPTGSTLSTAQACQQVVAPATGTPAPAAAAAPAGDPRLVILDPVFYLGKYPDLKQAFGNSVPAAQKHWLDHGIREGRQSSATFDLRTYLARYADLQKAFGGDFGAALNHWFQSGQREGRSATPQGSILRDAATGATFLVDRDGRRRGISTPQLFAECGLDWNNASNVTKGALDSVPTGPNFSSAAECQAARR